MTTSARAPTMTSIPPTATSTTPATTIAATPAAANSTIGACPKRSRKRVRFDRSSDSDVSGQERAKKMQILEYGPLSCEISQSEKQQRWLQDDDRLAIRKVANQEARECIINDCRYVLAGQPQRAFSETYGNIYVVCNLQNENDAECPLAFFSSDEVYYLAGSTSRGLEDRVVPRVAIERRLARARAINAVVIAQHCCKQQPEALKALSESFTAAARKMGQALGRADASGASIVWEQSQENGNIPGNVPVGNTFVEMKSADSKIEAEAVSLIQATVPEIVVPIV